MYRRMVYKFGYWVAMVGTLRLAPYALGALGFKVILLYTIFGQHLFSWE